MASWDVRCEVSRGNKQLLGQSSFSGHVFSFFIFLHFTSSGDRATQSRHSRSDRFRSRHDTEMHGDGLVTAREMD